jgi:cytochrome oxidase Cu insertion factor (SCO1/SenC/PrrC family)
MPNHLSLASLKGRARRTALAAVLLAQLATLGAAAHAAADGVQVGQPAPDFTATDSQGKTRHLSDFRGKTVVLEWTNADCPYTRKHYTSGNMQSGSSGSP